VMLSAPAILAVSEVDQGLAPPAPPIERSSALRRERHRSHPGERLREHRENAEVGVERDSLQAAYPQRCQGVVVLQSPEGSLDGASATVETVPPLALARDQRVQAGRLAPDRSGRALTGGAAPLRPAVLRVGTRERLVVGEVGETPLASRRLLKDRRAPVSSPGRQMSARRIIRLPGRWGTKR
jgi:hypothetical protein